MSRARSRTVPVALSDGRGWRGDPRKHPDPAMRAAVRDYMALHDGLLPDAIGYVRRGPPPRYLVHLGKEDASRYRRRVDDDGDGRPNPEHELYEHPFEHGAGSEIFYDERGQRHLLGGANKVTERGITDMRHSRKLLGFIPRVNPDYTKGEIITRGVGVALGALVINKVLDTGVDPFLSTDRSRSLVKTVAAGLIGLVISRRMPFLGTAFIAAGALEIGQLAYREMGLDRYEAMARDRVAAIAARMRAPASTPAPTPGTSGVYDMNGARAHGALDEGRSRLAPDPAAIRGMMNARS